VPVEIFLNLLLLHRLQLALDQNQSRDWVLAGILAGLAALTRPNILLFALVFCAWLLWRARTAPAALDPRRPLALFLIPVLLVVLPVTLRNFATEPELVIISSNGGVNFYISNNADYQRTVSLRPGMQWEDMVMEPVREGRVSAAAKSAFFFEKSLAYIIAEPLDYLGLLLTKGYQFWSGPEAKRNQDIYYARNHSRLLSLLLWDWYLSIPFGLIGPLSLLGLGLSLRERDPSLALLRLYALTYVASVVLFIPAARYRMPVLPVLIAFAAFAAWCLYLSARRRAWHLTAGLATPLVALLVFCNLERAAPTTEDAQLYFDLGEVHLRKGAYDEAERHSRRALELDPFYNYARHNLAVTYFHQGRYAESEQEALETAKENPQRADTQVLLGRIYAQTQRPQRAADHLRSALELDPTSGMAHYYYGRLLYHQGHYAKAARELQLALAWQPRDFWLHYELGRALQQGGKPDGALAAYERALALERRPEAANAIGTLHLLAGRTAPARTRFREALALDPGNLSARVNLALLDLGEGRLEEAVTTLRSILDESDYPPARRLLAEAYLRAVQKEGAAP
jgi:tetratricopeptide (TPR) repeat protein